MAASSGDAVQSQHLGLKLATLRPAVRVGGERDVRSAPNASAYLRMRSGTRASSTANDSDAWGSRCADLPATAAGSGIRARKCSCHMEHCQMSERGGGMPPQSRAVTCIDSPDVAGHRLRAPDWPIHLDQLPASRAARGANFRLACFPGASQLHAR